MGRIEASRLRIRCRILCRRQLAKALRLPMGRNRIGLILIHDPLLLCLAALSCQQSNVARSSLDEWMITDPFRIINCVSRFGQLRGRVDSNHEPCGWIHPRPRSLDFWTARTAENLALVISCSLVMKGPLCASMSDDSGGLYSVTLVMHL